MKTLVVAATLFEVAPLLEELGMNKPENKEQYKRGFYNSSETDILITGAGMVFTTFYLSKVLALNQYKQAINAGIAGAIHTSLNIGQTVIVNEDEFYDLGAENNEQWLNMNDMGLIGPDDYPYEKHGITNRNELKHPIFDPLLKVKGITVNTVHGAKNSIENLKQRSNAQTESMEGAAFLYCCAHYQLPCLQLRAISNYVEPRNKEAWQIDLAIKQLNKVLIGYFSETGKAY